MSDLGNKLRLMVARGIVKLIKDSAKIQELQVQLLEGEVRGQGERFQNYGFTSHPKPGAEAIVVMVGGDRSHPVILVVDDRRYRLKNMNEGEVAIYTDEGDYIWIKRNGNIAVKASTQVNVECPSVNMTGNLNVEGNITCDNNVSDENGSMNEMRGVYNTHKHTGIQTGGGTSGNPNATMT